MVAAADGQCGAVGVGRLAALALVRGRVRVVGTDRIKSEIEHHGGVHVVNRRHAERLGF